MAALAKGNDTDAVMRGRFVREALLCQHLPPPPDAVAASRRPPMARTPSANGWPSTRRTRAAPAATT